MTLQRWKCTSYCLCGSRKGHFEKSDEGVWVRSESAQTLEQENEQLRGTLSLAEEGLANYAQENQQLRECWAEALGNVTARNQEIERLQKKCAAMAWLLYGQSPDGSAKDLRQTLREILDELQLDDCRHDLQAKIILALGDVQPCETIEVIVIGPINDSKDW